MIEAICAEIRNYFTERDDKHFGTFTVSDGALLLPFPVDTDYVRIWDSRLNDGTYKVKSSTFTDGKYRIEADGLRDETFDGAVWIMSPPKGFLDIVADIEVWEKKYGNVDGPAYSPFTSESFAGTYSYSKSEGSGDGKASGGWQKAFAERLNVYRRLRI